MSARSLLRQALGALWRLTALVCGVSALAFLWMAALEARAPYGDARVALAAAGIAGAAGGALVLARRWLWRRRAARRVPAARVVQR